MPKDKPVLGTSVPYIHWLLEIPQITQPHAACMHIYQCIPSLFARKMCLKETRNKNSDRPLRAITFEKKNILVGLNPQTPSGAPTSKAFLDFGRFICFLVF
jgi:hypothetical protein